MKPRHFLRLGDLSRAELLGLIARADVLKAEFRERRMQANCKGRVLAMIFEKSSTRTRVSFETAMAHLGGHAIFIAPGDSQLVRGEPPDDTSRVLSQMVDCIVIRTHGHERLETFAAAAGVPVINGLSDTHHPCQLLADLQTYMERRGGIQGRKVVWIGDGNNVCHSYIEAAGLLDFRLHIACPDGYKPSNRILSQARGGIVLETDAAQAVAGADLVVTDVWTSMGQEADTQQRRSDFKPYQVNAALMRRAAADALFMHCLPAHRGEEVSADVIDGPQSVVWEEAGNRLHAQKALLEFLLR